MSPESTTKLVYRFFGGLGLIASLLPERVEGMNNALKAQWKDRLKRRLALCRHLETKFSRSKS
jgi:hypothetical protein